MQFSGRERSVKILNPIGFDSRFLFCISLARVALRLVERFVHSVSSRIGLT